MGCSQSSMYHRYRDVLAHVQHAAVEAPNPFNQMPDDVLELILQHMSFKRFMAFAATCHDLRERFRNRVRQHRMDQTCLGHRPVFMQKAHRFMVIPSSMMQQLTNVMGIPDQALVWGTPQHGRRHLSWRRLAEFVEQRRAGGPKTR
jgi:F-box domain